MNGRTPAGAGAHDPAAKQVDGASVAQGSDGMATESTTLLADVFQTGYDAGWFDGWEDGYTDGFEAGTDVGGARIMIGLKAGWPDLTALSPSYGEWRRNLDAGPCDDPRCGACGVRRGWLDRYGRDFAGVPR